LNRRELEIWKGELAHGGLTQTTLLSDRHSDPARLVVFDISPNNTSHAASHETTSSAK
jgi:hypothetical protein